MNKLVILFFIVLLTTNVFALQVSPAKKTVTFEPNTTTQYQLRIVNDQQQNLFVSLSLDGPFSKDVQITPQTFALDEQTTNKLVTVRFIHPSKDLLIPGRNRMQLLISAASNENTQFNGAITLAHNLDVIRLYDGAFLESQLRVSQSDIALTLTNLGQRSTIAQATALITDTTQSYTVDLGKIAVQANTNTKLEAKLPNLLAGNYFVNATFTYNDPLRGMITQQQTLNFNHLTALLRYGELQGSFTPGQIVQITLPVFLRWNKPLTTYTDLMLYDDDSLLMQQRTPQQILPSNIQSNITGFLDLTQIDAGNYTLTIATYNDGLLIGERKEQFIVQTKQSTTPTINQKLPIFALVLVILLCIITLLIIVGRKRK